MNVINKSGSQKLRDLALSCGYKITKGYLEFAQILWEIRNSTVKEGDQEKSLWLSWGYPSWEQYIEEELKTHYSRATNLVRLHQKIVLDCNYALDDEIVRIVRITNLFEISKIATPENVVEWMAKGQKLACCELKAAVYREMHGSGPSKVATFTRVLPAKGMREVRKAMNLAMEKFETATTGDALVALCADFNSRYGGPKKPQARVTRPSHVEA